MISVETLCRMNFQHVKELVGLGGGCGCTILSVFGSLGAGCSPEMLVATWRNYSVAFGGGNFQCN